MLFKLLNLFSSFTWERFLFSDQKQQPQQKCYAWLALNLPFNGRPYLTLFPISPGLSSLSRPRLEGPRPEGALRTYSPLQRRRAHKTGPTPLWQTPQRGPARAASKPGILTKMISILNTVAAVSIWFHQRESIMHCDAPLNHILDKIVTASSTSQRLVSYSP